MVHIWWSADRPLLVHTGAVRIPSRGVIMDTNRILAELREERDRIDQAIAALEALNSTGRQRVGRPPRAAATRRRRGRMYPAESLLAFAS